MVPGSLGELERRAPGSVPPQVVDEGEGVHFVQRGNSQAHEGFFVATADVAFAAEFGAVAAAAAVVVFAAAAVVAVAVSFVAAARAVVAAAAAVVAAAVRVVDAE